MRPVLEARHSISGGGRGGARAHCLELWRWVGTGEAQGCKGQEHCLPEGCWRAAEGWSRTLDHTQGLRTPLRLLPPSAGRRGGWQLMVKREAGLHPRKPHPVGPLPRGLLLLLQMPLEASAEARLRTSYSVLQTPPVPATPGALTDMLIRWEPLAFSSWRLIV
ncbi:hypothetical protein NDU88_001852 [Pleurodeles waltl]|uniref:Uncharacterized protein n=1 Tax=Pleurodeles waltl TaxID=8319 RepID=A0AAV7W1N6_PLEWA|nr:hypothetical protein NDU88_001852 [Pleurodeles waltl]